MAMAAQICFRDRNWIFKY